jgi:nitrous oxidase accessory protein NosD
VQVRRGSRDVAVVGNLVTGALTGSAFSLASQTAGTAPLAPATGLTLTDNVGTGNAQSGIVATPGADISGALIARNVLSGNTNGMLLAAGTRDNVFRENVAGANRAFGIRLLAGTSGNLLADNVLTGSGTTDARDESDVVADGVTALLNTWTGTTCATDFPVGSIC